MERKDVTTIAADWAELDRRAAASGIPWAQRNQMRRVYYAGAGCVWDILVANGPPTQRLLHEINAEFAAYQAGMADEILRSAPRRGQAEH